MDLNRCVGVIVTSILALTGLIVLVSRANTRNLFLAELFFTILFVICAIIIWVLVFWDTTTSWLFSTFYFSLLLLFILFAYFNAAMGILVMTGSVISGIMGLILSIIAVTKREERVEVQIEEPKEKEVEEKPSEYESWYEIKAEPTIEKEEEYVDIATIIPYRAVEEKREEVKIEDKITEAKIISRVSKVKARIPKAKSKAYKAKLKRKAIRRRAKIKKKARIKREAKRYYVKKRRRARIKRRAKIYYAKKRRKAKRFIWRYVASRIRKRFHIPRCEWAKKINIENKIKLRNKRAALRRKLKPCSICLKKLRKKFYLKSRARRVKRARVKYIPQKRRKKRAEILYILPKRREKIFQGEYIASKIGKKFHKPDCGWAEKIEEENKIWLKDKEDALQHNLEPCYCVG